MILKEKIIKIIMYLTLKNLYSWNLKGTTVIDDTFNNLNKWKNKIIDTVHPSDDSEELNILCIQGLYGYRSGFIGKILNSIGCKFSKYISPTLFKNICGYLSYDICGNDFEILAFLISMLTRIIPINNINTFDMKEYLHVQDFTCINNSQPSMFDLRSLFMFKPLFDSGCAIYANKKCEESGFEKWNDTDSVYNQGMVWAYFKSDTCETGITVINLDFPKNNNDIQDIIHIKQIVELKHKLEQKYSLNLESYETYITGNFNIVFNFSNIISELNIKLDILKRANINVINAINNPSSTEYTMYSKINNKTNNKTNNDHDDLTEYATEFDSFFYKFKAVKFIKFIANPLFFRNNLISPIKHSANVRHIDKSISIPISIPIDLNPITTTEIQIAISKEPYTKEISETQTQTIEETCTTERSESQTQTIDETYTTGISEFQTSKNISNKKSEVQEYTSIEISCHEGVRDDYFGDIYSDEDEWEQII